MFTRSRVCLSSLFYLHLTVHFSGSPISLRLIGTVAAIGIMYDAHPHSECFPYSSALASN